MNIFIMEGVVLHYHDIMPHSLYHLVIYKCHNYYYYYYYCYYHVLILIPSKEYYIFAHISVNSNCSIMVMVFAHNNFSCIYDPARNARKYVLREHFYVYNISVG